MQYADTSLLVSALTANEQESERSLTWLGEQPPGSIAISDWTLTEFASALSIKTRMRLSDEALQTRAMTSFYRMVEKSFVMLAIERRHFHLATSFAGDASAAIRASDALHLAVASLAGLSIRTLDRRLVSAAHALGREAALV